MPIIALDGMDGSGKSTAVRVLHDWLSFDRKQDVEMHAMPGATELGAELRKLVKSKKYATDPWTERLIFSADNMQFFAEKLQNVPDNKFIICDRWSQITDLIYGCAAGLDLGRLNALQKLSGIIPCDLYLVFKLSPAVAIERKNRRNEQDAKKNFGSATEVCRIEEKGAEYLTRVGEEYNGLMKESHAGSILDMLVCDRALRIRSVDASVNLEGIHTQVKSIVYNEFLKDRK